MKIAPLTAADTRNEIICDAFLLTGIETFAQLMDAYDAYGRKYPDHSLLVSLDDYAQAQYTCTHAIMSHGLDDTEGHDLSSVDPSVFEDGQHMGFLSTKSEFFIRRDNFVAKAARVGFEEACARGLQLDDEDLDELVEANDRPESILDGRAAMWLVPVRDRALALCAFPNGYFTADLSPFENHAVAVHLRDRFGYELFGIGASWLGFRRDAPLGPDAAAALAGDIGRLYHVGGDGERIRAIRGIVERHAHLLLRYTE